MEGLSKHIKDVCKIGQGSACCRYFKEILDARARNRDMVAVSDNCEGHSITPED